MNQATRMIDEKEKQGDTPQDGNTPYSIPRSAIYFLNDDMVRCTSDLRPDYTFPPLHDFLRYQVLGLTILPSELGSLSPTRNENEEKFYCKVNPGSIKIRMVSPVFNQNLYLGVYEDLMA